MLRCYAIAFAAAAIAIADTDPEAGDFIAPAVVPIELPGGPADFEADAMPQPLSSMVEPQLSPPPMPPHPLVPPVPPPDAAESPAAPLPPPPPPPPVETKNRKRARSDRTAESEFNFDYHNSAGHHFRLIAYV